MSNSCHSHSLVVQIINAVRDLQEQSWPWKCATSWRKILQRNGKCYSSQQNIFSLSDAAQDQGRVSCQSLAFMRGFIFIWWSCRPLFPEWIIRICRCWALFILCAVAESIRSILHTIFKIIQDRQHNSHSIRIQMTADGGTTYWKNQHSWFSGL